LHIPYYTPFQAIVKQKGTILKEKEIISMNWYTASKENKFCRGYCAEFAIALQRLTGWEMVEFCEIEKEDDEEFLLMIHAACRTPDGKFADVRGIRSEQEISMNLMGSNLNPAKEYKTKNTTERDMENEQTIYEELINEATEYIIKNCKKYGLTL
jgi:hypothetical protein